jgi:hypothetical protein
MSKRLARQWEEILSAEGLSADLLETRPRPTLDREWRDHFGTRGGAYTDACERLRIDAQSAGDLFSMLADIRWDRSQALYPHVYENGHESWPLCAYEREVFDPYCDGQSFGAISIGLGLSASTVMARFYRTLERFTPVRPAMRRNTGHRSKTSNTDK